MFSRVRCWKCGGIGHIAAKCPGQTTSSQSGSTSNRQFVVAGASAAHDHFEFGFVETDRETSNYWLCLLAWPVLSSPSMQPMGEPMGDIGISRHRGGWDLDRYLLPRSLAVLGALVKFWQQPISLGRKSGNISTAICAGDIPFLLPLPLLAVLKALVDTSGKRLLWPDGTTTDLTPLPSGHDAVSLVSGLDSFAHCARATDFQRSAVHEEVPCRVREALAQKP
eukprot:4592307-Amphidinium_carterae.2